MWWGPSRAHVHRFSWRRVFYVNIPLALACAAVMLFAYHEKVERHDHRLDFAGAVLLSLTVVFAFLAARTRGEGLGVLAESPTDAGIAVVPAMVPKNTNVTTAINARIATWERIRTGEQEMRSPP